MRLLLLATVVLAAFSHTGFAGKMATPAGYDQRAFAAYYTLPDGTLPVLCDWIGGGDPHRSTAVPCEFCNIASAAFCYGGVPDFDKVEFQTSIIQFHLQSQRHQEQSFREAGNRTRAPPQTRV